MEARLTVLIFALLCLAGIRSEASDEQESSDGLKRVTDDHSPYMHAFAEASLKVITKGTKINSLSNITDIHEQLDYAKTYFLSEKENATNNPDLQRELETKIEIIEFLCRTLNYSEENAQKKELENLNGYINSTSPNPTKMEILFTSSGMLLEDHTLEQSESGQYIVKNTIPPFNERFGQTTDENITLKNDSLKQSQTNQNFTNTAFPPSSEPFGENGTTAQTVSNTDSEHMKDITEMPTDTNNLGELFVNHLRNALLPKFKANSGSTIPPSSERFEQTTNENITLKNDILKQSQTSQNLTNTAFPPSSELFGENGTTAQTVFNTDSENMKDITEIPTDSYNSSEHFMKHWLDALFPKSKTNSGHLSQILPFSPIGKFSRRDEKQNSDMKAKKNEMILNIWKIILEEIGEETGLDKHDFLNLSSSTLVTGMEMNTTDPTSHPSEFDESLSSTLEISNMSYSIKDLPKIVDDANSTMFNDSDKIKEHREIVSPSENVSLKMNTFDFMKDDGKRTGKAKDIADHFLNTSENKIAHSSSNQDITEIPTDSYNSSEHFMKHWLDPLFPKSKTNSGHLSQILPFSPIGKFSRRHEKQNSDMKAKKNEMILNIWKIILEEIGEETGLDKHDFLNLSSSTLVTGMEMNTTDPTSHPSEFDESLSSTLEISNMSYSIKDLPKIVDDANSTMFNDSDKIKEHREIVSPSENVSLKMNTFDFMKDDGKRAGKAKDIADHFLNTSENRTAHSSSFAKSNDFTFNDTKLTFKKQLPWIENIPLNFTGDSKEASSFIAFETKEFQAHSDLDNNMERNAPKWNLPRTETQRSNVTEDEFNNFQATTLISSNTLQSEANNSSTKQSSATVVPIIFGMNYTLSTDHTFIEFSTNSYNKNETRKHSSSLSVSGDGLLTAIEGLKENDHQRSFLGTKAKSLEYIAPRINAEKVNSRFPVTIISVKKEPSAVRDMIQEYANKLEQNRSALKDIYSHEKEPEQLREYSRVSNIKDSENRNIMEFTKETQRDQKPWKIPLYISLSEIPTGFERLENEHAAKTDDSTINRNMEEKSGAIVKILIPLRNVLAPGHQNKRINNTMVHANRNVRPENMEEQFWNESSPSLQIEMKPFGIKHSNKIPRVYSSIKIEYKEYIDDRNSDEIGKGDFINFQVGNSHNNGTNQLAKMKRSGGKDHW